MQLDTCLGLEDIHCINAFMWECSCVDCVSNIFCVRADFGMQVNHIFPWDVLVVISLIRCVLAAVVVVSKAFAGCEMGFCLCSIAAQICRPRSLPLLE